MNKIVMQGSGQHAVLVVDDEDVSLHYLVRGLRQQPYQLYTARSGQEAMAVLKARPIDLIVSDEQMPGMCGSDLMAWVAANFPDVVRIMLTGRATTEVTIRAINEGSVLHFFTKPCDVVQLAIAIRKALEHKDLEARHHRLLESSGRQEQQFAAIQRELASLSALVSESLRKPLERICREASQSSPPSEATWIVDACTLLHTATAAAAQVARLSDELSTCRSG
jgi:two-component system, probable response regulator PhcQ